MVEEEEEEEEEEAVTVGMEGEGLLLMIEAAGGRGGREGREGGRIIVIQWNL